MKPPILFNRLGDATQVGHSVVGSGGSWTGTETYASCKFGNGSYSNGANAVRFPVSLNPDIFTIEFWVKTDYDVNNGVPDVSDTNEKTIFHWCKDNNDYPRIYLNLRKYDSAHTGIWFGIYDGSNFIVRDYEQPYGLTWSANTLSHIEIVYNKDNIKGQSYAYAFYLNGQFIYSKTGSGDTMANAGLNYFQILEHNTNSNFNFHGTIDNLKIYDYNKTDFSDRFYERSGLNDQIIK